MNKLMSAGVLAGAIALGYAGTTLSARAVETQDPGQDQIRAQISDRQVQVILTRIRTSSESLLTALDGSRPRGRVYGTRTRETGDVAYLVDDLVQASIHLSEHVTRRQTIRTDLDDFLGRADAVDDAFTRTSGSAAAQSAWRNIRRDVESLASAYSVTWDWQNPQYPGMPGTGVYQRLTGTYQLDVARSDNPQRVIDTAVRTVAVADRARVTRQLVRRLDPPDVLAIDRDNRQVTIGSSLGPQVTIDADGQARSEANAGGGNVTTRATLYGDQLEVTTSGAALDYSVTFEPLSGGRDLQVTRRIYNDSLGQPVTLRTVYRRTSETADWTMLERAPSSAPTNAPSTSSGRTGMIVPDGTTLVASLGQTINLRTARDDDRVTLTVQNSPRAELQGATIEGYVRRSSDDKGVVFQFDQIRLRNGRTSQFDGVIQQMTGPNGETVPFDGEQTTSGNRGQTKESIERGAMGAAIGAILGAIVSGGKGAAIGAVVGGGGAAATVLVGGQSQLVRGTQFTIRSRAR
ncbi:MAG: hypothetical protein ABIP90_05855 [Vicinamibacterales bacterium]